MLCLDTATVDVAAAVVDVDHPARGAVRIRRDARGAGEHLMPLVLDALDAAGASLADLTAVAVGLGPGPFTGLRAGVVTAAVLARTLGVPAYGACSLDVLAAGRADPPFVVVTDARRREVYWANYNSAGMRVEGPNVDLPAVVAAHSADLGLPLIGPGCALYPELLGGAATEPDTYPVASLAGLVAERVRRRTPGEVLVPLYLRRPDAAEPATEPAAHRPRGRQ